jgi:hypothetical protein
VFCFCAGHGGPTRSLVRIVSALIALVAFTRSLASQVQLHSGSSSSWIPPTSVLTLTLGHILSVSLTVIAFYVFINSSRARFSSLSILLVLLSSPKSVAAVSVLAKPNSSSSVALLPPGHCRIRSRLLAASERILLCAQYHCVWPMFPRVKYDRKVVVEEAVMPPWE